MGAAKAPALLDRIARHGQARKKIEVPEWGEKAGEPFVFWCKSPTAAEREACQEKARTAKGDLDTARYHAFVIQCCAFDDAGKKVFSLADVALLVAQADHGVLHGVAVQILMPASFEDLEKN